MVSALPSATDFIRKASQTAHHFGFRDLTELREDERCRAAIKDKQQPKILSSMRRIDSLQGLLAGGAAHYYEHNLGALGEPAMFYTIEEIPRSNDLALTLHIIGINKSIAEALLIQTVRSLFNDLDLPEHHIRINSLGDRESLARYTRELGNYLKKRLDLMPPPARELMKEHALTTLNHLLERGHDIAARSPSPLEYLNETSRKHFREIVEYLDFTGAPYEIDARLLGHHQCYSQTLFSVNAYADADHTIELPIEARGGRYDEFFNQHAKKGVSAVGAVITLRERRLPARVPRVKPAEPQIFIVQLGFGPKLRSLAILEELKGAQISAHQALASDSLSAQLEQARRHDVPYTIILGQKEYVDNTIILRDMRSSSQVCLPMANLTSHLKRALKV